MSYVLPLRPNSSSLHSNWVQLDHACNSALVQTQTGSSETLIYVVFGTDFIAGLRVDRRTWIFLPNSAVTQVRFDRLGARNLPPVRQVSDDGRTYLQGLGAMRFKVWMNGRTEPLPAANAQVIGRWVALKRAAPVSQIGGSSGGQQLERLVSFDSIAVIEIADVDNSTELAVVSGNFGKTQTERF
jgi:hypothetical protein